MQRSREQFWLKKRSLGATQYNTIETSWFVLKHNYLNISPCAAGGPEVTGGPDKGSRSATRIRGDTHSLLQTSLSLSFSNHYPNFFSI